VWLTRQRCAGSEKLRPLLRHYLPSTEYILFIHNCADEERLDEQIEEFHRVAKGLAEGGGRYIFVILNKQDLLPPAQRRHHVADIMRRYEQESTKHADKLTIDVLDLPYLSATKSSDAELHVILDRVQESLRRGPKPRAAIPTWNESRPAAKRPRADLDDLKRQARQMIDADGASADEFWQSLERGDVQEWNHYSHLRAGFFALVEGATSSMTLFDCADVLISKVKYLEALKPDHSFHDATHRQVTPRATPRQVCFDPLSNTVQHQDHLLASPTSPLGEQVRSRSPTRQGLDMRRLYQRPFA